MTSAGRPVGDDAAAAEHDGARAQPRHEVDGVGRDHQGRVDGAQERDERLLARGIEPGGRLVEQQHARPHGEHAGETGALLLAEAELLDGTRRERGDAEGGERAGDATVALGVVEPLVGGAEAHVLGDGGAEELIVGVLEDDADAGGDRVLGAADERPSTVTLPSTGCRPMIARNRVVLPAPLPPTTATRSPAPMRTPRRPSTGRAR